MTNPFFNKLNITFHEFTSFARTVPDFFIIGNSFCGKTLLYNYLTQHRSILSNLREETGFFTDHYEKGNLWYKSNFPFTFTKHLYKLIYGKIPLVGETINIPFTDKPEKISKIVPLPKIIVILRNPVERTYARYHAMVRAGIETLSFEKALSTEDRWTGEKKEMKENKIYYKNNKKVSRYLSKSIYIDDLEWWTKFFPKENMIFLKSEDLFNDTLQTVNQSIEFLGLSPLKKLITLGINYEKDVPKMNPDTKKELLEYFKPYNERLYNFVGKDLGWDS